MPDSQLQLKGRYAVLGVVVLLVLGLLAGKLWTMQVLNGQAFAAQASANRVRDYTTTAPRGRILDTHGKLLVANKAMMAIFVDPTSNYTTSQAGKRVENDPLFERLSAVLNTPVKDLNLYYSYVWDVNRVYGDVNGLPAANTDFDSRSHLINVSYSGWQYGRFVGYAYLLDLSNGAGNANSSATYGGYFAGAAPVNDKVTVDYRAEFAWQDQYADNPQKYSADYYNFELGANIKPIAIGTGYEVLGSGANSGAGGGRLGFKTPLASLHPFNGWAEVFITHPNNGLQDIYEYAQVT